MRFEKWMENITIDDLPNDDLKLIAQTAGLKYALLLIWLCSGVTVVIPNNPFSKVRENYIVNHYDGSRMSINRLAIECGLSQRHIYRILKRRLHEPPPEVLEE